MKARNDWIDTFVEATDGITSPVLFRRWAGISMMAAAMERKGWVHTLGSDLYPNLYVVLVAPPGVGKTEVTWRVNAMISSLDEHHLASSSVTKASLIDELNAAERRIVNFAYSEPVVNFNSLFICSNELGVLIPNYENEFMNTLTDLYDNRSYGESRRTKNIKIHIPNPQLNLCAACTPAYLHNMLPEGAWDQGFLSRVILVYDGTAQLRDLFAKTKKNTALFKELEESLKSISEVFGKFEFTPDAEKFMNNWHMNGGQPKPDHPKLAHYCTRRTAHLLKLSMCISASENDDRLIAQKHVERALDILIEAEFHMTDIFIAMSSGGDARVIEDTWYYLYKIYLKGGKQPILETRLILFLQERTPAHNIAKIIEVMERAGLIKMTMGKAGKEWTPRGKKAA